MFIFRSYELLRSLTPSSIQDVLSTAVSKARTKFLKSSLPATRSTLSMEA